MELVDSKQKVLTPPDILMGTLENENRADEVSLMALISSIGSPNIRTVQTNNTFFSYAKGKHKKRTEAVTHIYNMDVVNNLHLNLLKYLAVMQKRKLDNVIFLSKDKNFLGAFLKILPVLNKYGTTGGVGEKISEKTYMARVTFGKALLGKKKP
jgi:hypothetical protein|tara:strand:+ start:23 stop:484 length:462 start_codon:yes stop_codon:yes gene_type:complete